LNCLPQTARKTGVQNTIMLNRDVFASMSVARCPQLTPAPRGNANMLHVDIKSWKMYCATKTHAFLERCEPKPWRMDGPIDTGRRRSVCRRRSWAPKRFRAAFGSCVARPPRLFRKAPSLGRAKKTDDVHRPHHTYARLNPRQTSRRRACRGTSRLRQHVVKHTHGTTWRI